MGKRYLVKIMLILSGWWLCVSHPLPIYAGDIEKSPVTLELQQANLSETIRLMAHFLRMNVVISPSVQGMVSLSLQEASPKEAWQTLLVAAGLNAWPVGKVLLIAPQEELVKRRQAVFAWQQTMVDTAPLVTETWRLRYAKASDVAHLLQDGHASFLTKRGYLSVDKRTNVICVQDVMSSIVLLKTLIRRLDVPVKQIVIMARLASVDSSVEEQLGIQFAVTAAHSTASPEQGKYSVAVATLADGSLLDVKLAALVSSGHAELISRPSLFTANEQTASIESGEEVPYQEVSDSGGTAVVFKKAVLSLKVTPQVLPGNKVLLQLQINQDRPNATLVLGMPTISTQQIMTSVLINNGQTMVLGGVYETDKTKNEERIPWISRIPVVGSLFRQRTYQSARRELLVFVTPKIIN